MKESPTRHIPTFLEQFAASADEPEATLADALTSVSEEEITEQATASLAEARERISVMVARLTEQGLGPTSVIESLVAIDEKLMSHRVLKAPFATRLAALVAERALHAIKEQLKEEIGVDLAETSPIYLAPDKTLHAVPSGHLNRKGRARFAERVLSSVLKQKPKRVFIVLSSQSCRFEASRGDFEDLVSDIQSQRIKVTVIDPLT